MTGILLLSICNPLNPALHRDVEDRNLTIIVHGGLITGDGSFSKNSRNKVKFGDREVGGGSWHGNQEDLRIIS
jgi:hypothetical protein